MRAGAPYFTGTVTTAAVTSAQGTVGLGDLLVPGEASTIFDAGAVTVAIRNGADQDVTGVTVLFSDGSGATFSNAVSSPSIAAGASEAYYLATTAILRFVDVEVTFTTAPTAGKVVSITLVVQGH